MMGPIEDVLEPGLWIVNGLSGWYRRAFEVDLDAIGCLHWDARGWVRACRPSAALKSQYEAGAGVIESPTGVGMVRSPRGVGVVKSPTGVGMVAWFEVPQACLKVSQAWAWLEV